MIEYECYGCGYKEYPWKSGNLTAGQVFVCPICGMGMQKISNFATEMFSSGTTL